MRSPACVIATSALLLVSAFSHSPAQAAGSPDRAAPSVVVTMPVLDVRPAAEVSDTLASRPGAVVFLEGQSQPRYLPASADTYVWKDDARTHGGDTVVALRDGRWCQGLFKLDLEGLPPGAAVRKAEFRVFAGWRERPGGATLAFHRMLTDWSEGATFFKPFPDRETAWNGLRAGVDYEAKPFATFQQDSFPAARSLSIDGFESAIQAWAEKKWPNRGFVVLMTGKAMQVNLDSREARERRSAAALTLGGPDVGELFLRLDLPLMQRALLAPDDLLGAALRLKVAKKQGNVADAVVYLYRLLQPATAGPLAAGVHFAPEPIASAGLAKLSEDGFLRVPGLEAALRSWMDGRWPDHGVLLRLSSEAKPSPQVTLSGTGSAAQRPALEASIKSYPRAALFDHEPKPRPGVYVTVKDGHLAYGGRRLKLWGVVGFPVGAERIRSLGFNAQRLWRGPKLYDDASAKRGEPLPAPSEKDAEPDPFDRYFADLKQRGMFVMFAALNDTMPLKPLLADDSFIAGGPDWEAWKQAVAAKGADPRRFILFDERLQAIRKRHASNLLSHVNPCTGKRYAEDEAIAVYEVFNESGFVYWTLERGFDEWPAYFRQKLQQRWNAWLAARYRDDAGLKAAWGRLGEGESAAAGSVKLAPLSTERNAYPEPRGRDLVRFLIELVERFDRDFRDHCRGLAPAGVGVNVVPFSFDTQYRPSLPWLYTSARGDVNCFGMYFWGLGSGLGMPPSMYVLDNHTVAGRPTVLYETNQGRPCPYRAEYPLRLAALALWQDWDGVFWHYWAGIDGPDEQYLVEPMLHVNPSHYWTAVQHERDPVMVSAMAMAGRIFLGGGLRPAPDPVTFRAGGRAIFGFDCFNGLGIGQTTFARGSRIAMAPDADEGVTAGGQPVPPPAKVEEAVAAGREILWDWPRGRLILDAPTAKAYVGKTTGTYRFHDGIVLSGVNTPFVTFVLVSADGKPLTGPDASQRIYVAARFDAKNTGFEMDWSVTGGPLEQSKGVRNRGRPPVLVDKVAYTLSLPTLADYRFEAYDFALRRAWECKADASNVLKVPPSDWLLGVLSISRRGAAAEPVVGDSAPGDCPNFRAEDAKMGLSPSTGAAETKPAALWNPIPGLSWSDDYARAYELLRDSKLRFTSISPKEPPEKPDPVITLSEAEMVLGSPATIRVMFSQGRMAKLAVTFTRPPPLKDALAAYERQFGPAAAKTLAADASATSTAQWLVKGEGGELEILMTETQGTLSLLYARRPSR